jgi:hypothetical protein
MWQLWQRAQCGQHAGEPRVETCHISTCRLEVMRAGPNAAAAAGSTGQWTTLLR